MLTAKEIRESYKDFFRSKGHTIVPSAPMVIKDDPTLMFTNAGMNQFKDIILGNKAAKHTRLVLTPPTSTQPYSRVLPKKDLAATMKPPHIGKSICLPTISSMATSMTTSGRWATQARAAHVRKFISISAPTKRKPQYPAATL